MFLWTKPNVIRYIVLTPGDISTGSMTLSMSCGRRRADMTGRLYGSRQRNGRYVLFEMCLDLSLWVDAVICDYNYVFDPTVHLKRFFGEGAGGDYVFLIDEAHNLAERGKRDVQRFYLQGRCCSGSKSYERKSTPALPLPWKAG